MHDQNTPETEAQWILWILATLSQGAAVALGLVFVGVQIARAIS
jgi:hypothetical protein|tara:strand:+ start:494 stop:625 length:132 start_codon:yes stop_codon:yes gene_type:complete